MTITASLIYSLSVLKLAESYRKYTNSLNLAETGLNNQLNVLNQNISTGAETTFTQNSPSTTNYPSLGGTSRTWLSSASSSQAFANTIVINSIGYYSDVSRYLTIEVKKRGIFDDFAYFSFSPSSIGGGSFVNGTAGTNSTLSFSGSSNVTGDLYTFGDLSSITGLTKPIIKDPVSVSYPTIDAIVAKKWISGWNWLTSNNPVNRANGNISIYANLYSSVPLVAPDARWGANNYDLTNASFKKYSTKATLVFPPGEYYFQNIDLQSNVNLIVDNAAGPVNFWVSGSTLDDKVAGTVTFIYTNPSDPSSFRMYYNKSTTLNLGGNSVLGGIYAVKKGLNTLGSPATISMSGGSVVNGAIIGDIVNMQGNSSINHPGTMIGANDPAARFIFNKIYKEGSLSNEGVYIDGSKF